MSAMDIPADDLRDVASLLRACVPGRITNVSPDWTQGWQACCTALEAIADHAPATTSEEATS